MMNELTEPGAIRPEVARGPFPTPQLAPLDHQEAVAQSAKEIGMPLGLEPALTRARHVQARRLAAKAEALDDDLV